MLFRRFVPAPAVTPNRLIGFFLGTVFAVLLATSVAEAKSYKGAEVFTKKTYLYGRMEMRMRMIRGGGLLSTFFGYKSGSELANAFWEEIDIEVFGDEDAKIWQSNIISNNPKDHSEEFHHVETSLADDYHTYTIEWTPDYVLWLFDGKEVRKTEGGQAKDLTNPESFRFNVWSSEVESWAGVFDESSLPAYQFVSWFKYYRYEDGKFVLDWADDFKKFDDTRWATGTWTFAQNRVDFDPDNAVVKDGALILAITKEGETGFTGTVPVDPQGEIDDVASTGTGGSSGKGGSSGSSSGKGGSSGSNVSASSSGSSGGSSGSSSSADTSAQKPDTSGCTLAAHATGARAGWLTVILFGLALVGLRTPRRRR